MSCIKKVNFSKKKKIGKNTENLQENKLNLAKIFFA